MSWPTDFEVLDRNIFNPRGSTQFIRLLYSTHEMDKIIYYLSSFKESRKLIKEINILLQATIQFKYSITIEPYFAKLRQKTKPKEEIADIFTKMQVHLENAQSFLDTLKDKNDYQFFLSALAYVKTSLLISIEDLKHSGDEIFAKNWENSALQWAINEVEEIIQHAHH